jgi:hypothetical protein
MSLQESGLLLASVIGSRPEVLKEWEPFKSSSDSLPAQWHEKFWGKSMAEEEQKWRDAQLLKPLEGSGLGNEPWGGDESMYMGMSEAEGLDDDVIEGCYSLEVDIEGFAYPRIWIRAEYIRIYNALESHYAEPSYPYLAPSAVITGQPGIGES